jgi:hypothetical protein
VQKRRSVALRQASSALAHDKCVAHFEPPQARNARFVSADALKRQCSDRMVFVIESPARSDGGIEHEGHQYLCPSCLAETSSSTVIFPVPEFWGEVQPPASLKGLDIPSRRAVFVPWKTEQKAGVRKGKPDILLRNQCCRRGCTSRRNPPNEESEPVSLDGEDNREQKIIKYWGPAPPLYDENENDYKEIANIVRKQLIPTNILEEVWVEDYVDLLWELMRLRRYKSKLLCTAATDSGVRVISPLMFPRSSEARLLASGSNLTLGARA